MPSFAEIEAANPNIREQYDTWRGLRAERGEDPTDYQAFRQHVMAIGGPDPGVDEVSDFVGDDFRAEHGERYADATLGGDESASADASSGQEFVATVGSEPTEVTDTSS